MTRLFAIMMSAVMSLISLTIPPQHSSKSDADLSTAIDSRAQYETAVRLIKKYETLHSPRHWPLIGYGHHAWPNEGYKRGVKLTEKQADALLRKDLDKLCEMYRSYGKDSLLLAALAYNLGHGAVNRSSVVKQLKSGNRDIRDIYISYNKYRGKTHAGIRKRRIEEFDSLFIQ